jgi:large subunit ribosomal protein L16
LQLQPKNFKSKKKQKTRKFLQFSNNYFLKFGHMGLLLLQSIILTATHLSKFKFFLKKASKKNDKTKRKLWFNLFPHLPLSKKAANVRMGKGKGKLKTWYTRIKGGSLLVEYKNLRYGRCVYFFNQISYRLGIKTSKIFSNNFFFNFPFRTDKKIFFKSFWN